MPSQTLRLSDSAITKALADQGVTELADPRYPLRLRVRTCRTKASWYLVLNQGNKTKWLKLGVWPSLTAKAVIAKLPTLLANHAAAESVNCDDWQTVGELLAWYQERAATDSSLSANRRINVKCSLSKHLIPRLQLIKLIGLTHEVIETALIWPLQSQYKLGTVRQHFALLKRVFKLAHKQKRLAYDPLASMTFSDFIDAKIPAKEAAIRFGQTHLIKQQIERECEPARTLALFMLMHGTRIGETRQLRWSYIDWHHAQVHLPASITKTATALSLPLTDHAIELLQSHKQRLARQGYHGDFLFCSQKGGRTISPEQASEHIKSISQGEWSAHDLRKVARSAWQELGVDYMVAEQLINHAMSKLDTAYIHTHAETQKRAALVKWHDYIFSQTDDLSPRQPLDHHSNPIERQANDSKALA